MADTAPAAADAIRRGVLSPGTIIGAQRDETLGEWWTRAVLTALDAAGFTIVAKQTHDYLVVDDDGGWSIEHRPDCRREHRRLTDCPVHRAAAAAFRADAHWPETARPGRYRLTVIDNPHDPAEVSIRVEYVDDVTP